MSRDLALVLDVVNAARDARDFVGDMGLGAFKDSRLHQNAVIRSLEIIGEASNKLSREFRATHADVEWNDMIGMRNRLIHDYGGVRLSVVWNVVSTKLGPLIGRLTPLITPPDQPEIGSKSVDQ